MTREINRENAETIARPIVEKGIQLFAQNNHAKFSEYFPSMGVLKFDEAAESLRLLGETPSVKYLDHLIKPNRHLLLWKVQSQNSDMSLLLTLGLTENEDEDSLFVQAEKRLDETALEDALRGPTSLQISDENSESIGTPIIEKLLKSLLNDDIDVYAQILPGPHQELSDEAIEIFDEAVRVLKPMGNLISIKYLAHTKMTNFHTLIWKVRYQKDDEELMWQLMLTDSDGAIKLNGLSFDK